MNAPSKPPKQGMFRQPKTTGKQLDHAASIEESVKALRELYKKAESIDTEAARCQQAHQTLSDYEPALNKELLDSIKAALKGGPWDKGILFQTIGGKLETLLNELQEVLDLGEAQTSKSKTQAVTSSDGNLVYVLLYNSDGGDISKWERLLRTIGGQQVVNRPTYPSEVIIQAVIRAKSQKKNLAYIEVNIDPNLLLEDREELLPKDPMGNSLLVLKEDAVKSANIKRFVHEAKTYHFQDQKLQQLAD